MFTPDLTAGLAIGILSSFVVHMLLMRRAEQRHDEDQDEAYARGRRRGVHETWTTYVGPMETYVRNEFGRALNWPRPDCVKQAVEAAQRGEAGE